MRFKFFFMLSFALASCITSQEEDIFLNPTPAEDQAYYQILKKSTKTRTIIRDFENRYNLSATYLSPEFRSAFSQRLERVFGNAPMQFEEATAKAGFFVSIGSSELDRMDLTNPYHWSIFLGGKDQPSIKPILIKKLEDKERWRAFFENISSWTNEYLIVFDTPNVNPQSKDLVAKTPIKLMFANADAQLSLSW